MVRQGLLREDLFHRLNALRLHLPPLRERCEDIPFLLAHYLGVFAAKFRKPVSAFSAEALTLLADYGYPGNVRELRNMVEYAVMLCPGELVLPEHLPVHLRLPGTGGGGGAGMGAQTAARGRKAAAGKPGRA
jgi:DNA-binding NtrC family response regulator